MIKTKRMCWLGVLAFMGAVTTAVGLEEKTTPASSVQQLIAAFGAATGNAAPPVVAAEPVAASENWVSVDCQSPEGTFHMTGNPQTGQSEFKLEKQGKVVEGGFMNYYCRTRVPCKYEFIANKGAADSVNIRAHELLETWVPDQQACRITRAPDPVCHNVPGHHEWEERTYVVELFLESLGSGLYKTGLFFFRGYTVDGLLALGPNAVCKISGL